ncbi:hypothetical protein [Aeromicrobium sp. YIM 150415]|nr:hypothetical protein [Aeromicrobium sp. YIM 150415]
MANKHIAGWSEGGTDLIRAIGTNVLDAVYTLAESIISPIVETE